MDQKKLWQHAWRKKSATLPVNNFATKAFQFIKNGRYHTVLDVGCGNGQDALYFARKGMLVTAVDWSDTGLTNLRNIITEQKIPNMTVCAQDVSNLTFKPNSFDIIYAHLSLHYFTDHKTQKIFHSLHRILKKNGLLFVKCKSTDDALYGRGRQIEKNMYSLRGHIRHFFDKEYMAKQLHDFEIIQLRKTASVYHHYKSSFIEAVATKR